MFINSTDLEINSTDLEEHYKSKGLIKIDKGQYCLRIKVNRSLEVHFYCAKGRKIKKKSFQHKNPPLFGDIFIGCNFHLLYY